MELLERYLYAVGRWLPKKQKKDILAELESSIYDSLESKFNKTEGFTEDEVSEILKDLGAPWKIAAAYSGWADRLIGPELLPIYFTITAIVSGAVAIGLFVSFIVGIFKPDLKFIDFILNLLKLIPSLIASTVSVVGTTTIIFAVIDRVVPANKLKAEANFKKSGVTISLDKADSKNIKNEGWTPKDLPSVPKGKIKISKAEPIITIIFAVIAIVLFNFFRDKIGIYYTPSWGSGWEFVPILSESAVKVFLPFWNTVWGISIIFSFYQLIKGRWTLPMRISDTIRSFIDAAVLVIMIKGPELIDFELLLSYSKPEVADSLTPVAELFNYSINGFLIFALVATCIGILAKFVKIFKSSYYEKPF